MFQWGKEDLRHLMAFTILGIYIAARLSLGFSFSLTESIFSYDASIAQRLLLVFKALALYFLAIFNLFETPHPFWTVELPTSIFDPYVIGGVLICGLLLGAIWKSFKKEPLVAFGLAWFFIYFLPISNLKELNQPMAEHWLYLPMIGLSLAFGSALTSSALRLPEVRLIRTGVLTMVVGFLLFAALVTREKTNIYQNDESFLLAAVRANPQVARLYAILGSAFLAKQNIRRAKESYAKALNLDPSDFLANYRTGFLFHQAGQYEEAKIYLEKVARSNPARLSDIAAVAHAWEMLGQKQKALFYYRKALDLDSQSSRIRQKIAALTNSVSPLDK
jgi:tetratricopeptide (TPR) repeat protein